MKFQNLTVKIKLSIAFALLTLVVLIVSGISLKALNDASDRFRSFVDGINARAEMAQSIRAAVDDRAMAVRNLVLVTSPADVEIEKAAVLDAEQRVESDLDKFNVMVADAKDMS
jgi:phosphoglycerate-specific signal transduction histidine kinase